MGMDFLQGLLQKHVDEGRDPSYWWDEERVPLDSIDKRLTDLLDLSGMRAVVTGGAGESLGQACVNRLAGLGADVAIIDLRAQSESVPRGRQSPTLPPAESIAEDAAKKWGTRVVAVHGDVLDWESVHRSMRECHDLLGGIDILVNNAADAVLGDFSKLSREDIDRTVRGVFVGPLYSSRAALDYMIPQGRGRIINVGSAVALSAMPMFTLYGASKAGLTGFTKFLGKEVAKNGIRVLGVNPGAMTTPRAMRDPESEHLSDSAEGLYAMSRTAIQRYELPEEVANMIAFLASEASSGMVGVMVDMGGGMAL
ncbi:SDR family NAD(P)-dependent oxidoreductase [Streptomyces sp. NPDC055078]